MASKIIQTKGFVRGRSILLERETGFPDGTVLEFTFYTKPDGKTIVAVTAPEGTQVRPRPE